LNQDRNSQQWRNRYSLELAWLKSSSFHRLKPWIINVFPSADHFPRLYLNQGRNCREFKRRIWFKLDSWEWHGSRNSETFQIDFFLHTLQ
jgi:hypothetical protein